MNVRLSALLILCVGAGPATAQVVNGTFETGTLAGWTVGGINAAAAVRTSHFSGGTPPTVEGTWFALLSTGPEDRGGGAQRYDANTTNDFDFVSLTQTVTVPFAPAVVSFDWNYPSSEQDQGNEFDDLFDLRIGINGGPLVQAWSPLHESVPTGPLPSQALAPVHDAATTSMVVEGASSLPRAARALGAMVIRSARASAGRRRGRDDILRSIRVQISV